jgi:hypothetical protein
MMLLLSAGPEPAAASVWDASWGCSRPGGPDGCPACVNVQLLLHYMDNVSFFRDLWAFPQPVATSVSTTVYCLPEIGLNNRCIDGDRLSIVYLSSVRFKEGVRCGAVKGRRGSAPLVHMLFRASALSRFHR